MREGLLAIAMCSTLRIGLLPSTGVGAASRKAVVMMSEDGDTGLPSETPGCPLSVSVETCQDRRRKMRTEASLG